MSIESKIDELIAAIKENTAATLSTGVEVIDISSAGMEKAAEKKAPPPPDKTAATAPPPPEKVDSGSPTPTASAPPPPAKTISGDELNEILRKEFVRIGNTRDPIDKIMKDKFGATSLHNLKPEDFAELVTAVSEIPSV